MLGVRKPISPIEYALTSVWPMSSPQMITMLGCFAAVVCACAIALPPAAKKLETVRAPSVSFRTLAPKSIFFS